MIDSLNPPFSTRNFGRKIARDYPKEDVKVNDLKN